jgi:hypothetical protein
MVGTVKEVMELMCVALAIKTLELLEKVLFFNRKKMSEEYTELSR